MRTFIGAPRRPQFRPSSILSPAVGPSVTAVAVSVAVTMSSGSAGPRLTMHTITHGRFAGSYPLFRDAVPGLRFQVRAQPCHLGGRLVAGDDAAVRVQHVDAPSAHVRREVAEPAWPDRRTEIVEEACRCGGQVLVVPGCCDHAAEQSAVEDVDDGAVEDVDDGDVGEAQAQPASAASRSRTGTDVSVSTRDATTRLSDSACFARTVPTRRARSGASASLASRRMRRSRQHFGCATDCCRTCTRSPAGRPSTRTRCCGRCCSTSRTTPLSMTWQTSSCSGLPS